jgi:hypothetical protein
MFLFSCHTNEPKDLSGNYQNIDDYSNTQIVRLNDSSYVLIGPDGFTKINTKRKENTLVGIFKGLIISCEFNNTYDTIVGRENGNIVFTCKKKNE